MTLKDYHSWHMDKPKHIRKDKTHKQAIPSRDINQDLRNAYVKKCREYVAGIAPNPPRMDRPELAL